MNACLVFIFVLTPLAGGRPVPAPVLEPPEENKSTSLGESNAINLSSSGICPGAPQEGPSWPWTVAPLHCMCLLDSYAWFSTGPSSPKFDGEWSPNGPPRKCQAEPQCRAWCLSCNKTSASTYMVGLSHSCTCITLAGKGGNRHPKMPLPCPRFTSPWFPGPKATAAPNSSRSAHQQCSATELRSRKIWCCWYLEPEPGVCFDNGMFQNTRGNFPGKKLPLGAHDSHGVKHSELCEGRTWLAPKGHCCEGVWACSYCVLLQNWTEKGHPARLQSRVPLLGQEAVTIRKRVAEGKTGGQRALDETPIASGGCQKRGKEERPPDKGFQTYGPPNWYGGFFSDTQPRGHQSNRMLRPSTLYGGFFSSIRPRGRQTKQMPRPSSLYGGFFSSTWPRGYLNNRMLRLQALVDIVTKRTAQALELTADQQTQLRVAVQRTALDFLAAEERSVCQKYSWTDCCLGMDECREIIQGLAEHLGKMVDVSVRAKEGPYYGGLARQLGWLKRAFLIFCFVMLALCHLGWLVACITVLRQTTTKPATNAVAHGQGQTRSLPSPTTEPGADPPQPRSAQRGAWPLHAAVLLGTFVLSPAQGAPNSYYLRRRRWTL